MQRNLDALSVAKVFSPGEVLAIQPISHGSINQTLCVTYRNSQNAAEKFILQRMNPLFSPVLMDTFARVVPLLDAAHVPTPRPLMTPEGQRFLEGTEGGWWRAITFLAGDTHHDGITPAMAQSAGELLGKFHTALVAYTAPIPEPIPHFHDTEYIMQRLRQTDGNAEGSDKHAILGALTDTVRAQYAALNLGKLASLPRRLIHGDLKISNLLFEGETACALIDLDTIMRHTIAVEMGDALRSWCATAGEDAQVQRFDIEICSAAVEGYRQTATFLTPTERSSLLDGIELITLELAARFITDAYDESYFVKSERYASLFEQNTARARNQLAFLQKFNAHRHQLNF